jgi:hypothetical protein
VKEALFAVCPPTVTEIGPVEAPFGTMIAIVESLQLTETALVPFSETLLLPGLPPNPLPLMCTSIPTTPFDGDMPVIVGDCAAALTESRAMEFRMATSR